MYYEGRITTVWNIEKNEIKAVLGELKKDTYLTHPKRKDGKPYMAGLYTSVLYQFEHNGKKYGFANDASNCEGITELAILDMEKVIQIESLTIDWVKGNKLKAILDCCENPAMQKQTGLVIKDNEIIVQPNSIFTCGCCGTGFYSTQKVQSKFDQDAGYGICKECERFYL